MENLRGWQVNPNFDLPEGYMLREDGYIVLLYFNNTLIAEFTHSATTKTVVLAILDNELEIVRHSSPNGVKGGNTTTPQHHNTITP